MYFAKLRGAIREKYGTDKALAEAAGMRPSCLSRCLNGHRQWRGDEMAKVCQALDIPLSDVYLYFY